MLESSARVPTSNRPAGMATRMPAIHVAIGGGAEFGVDFGEGVGEQAVAGHREPDAGLAELEDEDRRDHADDGAEQDDEAGPVEELAVLGEGEALEGVDDGGGVADDGLPGDDAARGLTRPLT